MRYKYNPTGTVILATVVAVDKRRKLCKCLGDQGENLVEVQWIVPVGSHESTPKENDRVLVDIASGVPIISGSLATDTDEVERMSVNAQDQEPDDITDYSSIDTSTLHRGNSPKDTRVGDSILTSEGGLLGILRAGTFIAKSGALAQILLSRFGDLARIVSRNYEHFTDVDSIYKTSTRGKIYTKRDLYRTLEKSRLEQPNMVKYEGDVQAGETIEAVGHPCDIKAEAFPAVPADDGVIDSTKIFNDDASGVHTYSHTRDIQGTDTTVRQLTDSTKTITETYGHAKKEVLLAAPGETSSYSEEATGFTRKIGDKVQITENKSSVTIKADKTVITVNADGTISMTADADITMTATGNLAASAVNIDMTASGNYTVTAKAVKYVKG